jgi:hypothetical protein
MAHQLKNNRKTVELDQLFCIQSDMYVIEKVTFYYIESIKNEGVYLVTLHLFTSTIAQLYLHGQYYQFLRSLNINNKWINGKYVRTT